MKYIKLSKKDEEKQIQEVAEIIKNGGIAIVPTDTVYGITADALNEEAVKKIYSIKKRKMNNPCSILVSNINMIKQTTKKISNEEEKIIRKFFPGAITLVFEKNNAIPDIVTSGLNTIGIRMPDEEFLLNLIDKVGHPIVATSLNIAGEESKTDLENVSSEILDNVDCVLDNGKTKGKVASTVVKIEGKEINIIREGPITKDMLEKALEEEH